MKKSVAMLIFVLACSLSATAQSDMSGDTMKKDKAKGSGKMASMTGCISEKDGQYMMINKQHPDGIQLMSSEDLKPHVGHKVKVTGRMEKMGNTSGNSMKSDGEMAKDDKMKHDNMGMSNLKVDSMKMISEHCDMSKTMSK